MDEQACADNLKLVLHHEIDIAKPSEKSLEEFEKALWRSIEAFARRPQFFLDHVKRSTVREGRDDLGRLVLYRKLDFGNLILEDQALFAGPREVVFCVPALAQTPPSTFAIALEGAHLPRLSFTYREGELAGLTDNLQIMTLRKNAWRAKDRDVVARILEKIGGRIAA